MESRHSDDKTEGPASEGSREIAESAESDGDAAAMPQQSSASGHASAPGDPRVDVNFEDTDPPDQGAESQPPKKRRRMFEALKGLHGGSGRRDDN